jgi:class 3 adenylate cyclase
VSLGSTTLGIYAELTTESFVVGTLLGGLTVLAAAVVARVRQPANSIWRLLAATYFANFLWVLYFIPISPAWTLAELVLIVDAAVFAHLALAFPYGRLRSVAETRLVVALYAFAIGISLALLAVWQPTFRCNSYCPENVLLLWPSKPLADAISAVRLLSLPTIGMLVALLVWGHWRQASPLTRRALLPVAAAFPVILLWAAVALPAYLSGADAVVSLMTSPLPAAIVDLLLPAAFLVGALRLRMARGSVANAVLQLGALPTFPRLEDALRRRLGDPGLELLRWSPARASFVDQDGHAVGTPTPDSGQALTILQRNGARVAAIRHDAALLDEPALIDGILSAAAMAVDATEMRDELRARGGDVAGLPQGEVTFLFADIEQSTKLLESLGERYADVLSELRRAAARIAQKHGGRLVDARGDELFLVFRYAAGAVRASAELQSRLADTAWPQGVDVRMRIGLHLGRPELTTAGYVGVDVHIAARIMATARGRQIVASESVVAQLDPDEPISRRPLGRVALRGMKELVTLYSLAKDGPPDDRARRRTRSTGLDQP